MADFFTQVPPQVGDLVQKGLLERAFHDGLFPALQYRAEATAEEWPANSGDEVYMSRPGLLTPITRPLTPGQEPQPQAVSYEQWVARLAQFGNSVDTDMKTAIVANSNLFLRNIHQLGLNAGQSINRIARNALFKAYVSGNTCLTAATATGDTTISVAALNGFTDAIGANAARPAPVSSANPLSITIWNGSTAIVRNVVGYAPTDPNDPDGPGVLLLSATVGSVVATRAAVVSSVAPIVLRSGGGLSVDAIGSADTLTLQDIINAVAILRDSQVQPHDDGTYHAQISPLANSQIFADPVFQRLNQSRPEYAVYQQAFVGTIANSMISENAESPNKRNSGARTSTGTNAQYSLDIGAETTNDSAVDIGRVIVTGKGAMYERYLDESQLVTEAGTMGKIGEFDVTNNGISITLERIRLVLRAPMDRLQQVVSTSWSISTSFPVPSDITGGSSPSRFKRAVVIEHAT